MNVILKTENNEGKNGFGTTKEPKDSDLDVSALERGVGWLLSLHWANLAG